METAAVVAGTRAGRRRERQSLLGPVSIALLVIGALWMLAFVDIYSPSPSPSQDQSQELEGWTAARSSVEEQSQVAANPVETQGSAVETQGSAVETQRSAQTSLPAPAWAKAKAQGESVTISWASVPGAADYEVWRVLSRGGKAKKVDRLNLPIKSNTVTAKVPSRDWSHVSYVVRAIGSDGRVSPEAYTEWIKIARPLPAPAWAKVEADTETVKVSWAPVPGAAGYEVWMHWTNEDGAATGPRQVKQVNQQITVTVPSSIVDRTWRNAMFSVRAVDSFGETYGSTYTDWMPTGLTWSGIEGIDTLSSKDQDMVRGTYEDLAEIFGVRPGIRFRLWKTRDEYLAAVGGEGNGLLTAGMAHGTTLDVDMNRLAVEWRGTIIHEMVHAFQAVMPHYKCVPAWEVEGFAEYLTDGIIPARAGVLSDLANIFVNQTAGTFWYQVSGMLGHPHNDPLSGDYGDWVAAQKESGGVPMYRKAADAVTTKVHEYGSTRDYVDAIYRKGVECKAN